jgi:hypothetical protein
MARKFPKAVLNLCYGASGWLVGGAVIEESPKDYDIAIPFSHWHIAMNMIPRDASPNSFGGWSYQDEGVDIDVWPCELGELMRNNEVKALLHLQSGALFQRVGQ